MDSLVEVFASLVVVWHLGLDSARQGRSSDRRALRLVAVSFALLAATLIGASVRSLVVGTEADSSPLGIAYLAITACVMFGLAAWKRRVGRSLDSEPFLAEASMTFLDGCLASGILTALALNSMLGWWWADPLAAVIVASVAARESLSLWRDAAAVAPAQTG
jgi:divalent metal cation (Fe/Co/Zn/Cd) transporter